MSLTRGRTMCVCMHVYKHASFLTATVWFMSGGHLARVHTCKVHWKFMAWICQLINRTVYMGRSPKPIWQTTECNVIWRVHLYSITYIFESHAVALTWAIMVMVIQIACFWWFPRIQKWCNTYSRPWESTNSMCFLLHSKDSMDLAWEEICMKFVLESSYRLSCFIKIGVKKSSWSCSM